MIQTAILGISLPAYAITVMALLLNPEKCDFTRKRIGQLTLLCLIALAANIVVFYHFGRSTYQRFYQLLVQLPLLAGFWIISKYRGIRVVFTLLVTISLAALPVNFVILFRLLFHNNPAFMTVGCLLSFFLILFFILRFLRPGYLFMLKFGDTKTFYKFSTIPLLYYLYGYLISYYNFQTDTSLRQFLVRRIPEYIIFISYLMLTDIFKNAVEKQSLKSRESLYSLQLDAAAAQIEQLKASERQSAIYRHDLRHHMNYLNACISENRLQAAKDYIAQSFAELDRLKFVSYCPNDSVNLILTFYFTKAEHMQISVSTDISAVDFSRFLIIDICSLLSNALENALAACEQLADSQKRSIHLRMYERNNKLCIMLKNSYAISPVFEHGIPVSRRQGHGIGIKSIIRIIEKYRGVYQFQAENGSFLLQVSM